MRSALNGRIVTSSSASRYVRHVLIQLAILGASATGAGALAPEGSLSDYSITNWTKDIVRDSPIRIYAMAQDRDGYLWLGTLTGLIRFDGEIFTPWDGEPLPKDRISVLRASRDGSLWVGFATGDVARIRDGRVTSFGTVDGLATGGVTTLLEDDDGAIWVGSAGGLSVFRNERWEMFSHVNEGIPAEHVSGLFRDSRGVLWVGSSAGVYRRGPKETAFRLFAPFSVTSFAEDSSGTIWITDSDTAFRVLDGSAVSGRGTSSVVSSNGIGRQLLYDRFGNLWIGTRGSGLLRLRIPQGLAPTDNNGQPAVDHLTRSHGLISNIIQVLLEDRNGAIWVGSRNGLSRLSETGITTLYSDRDQEPFVNAVTRTRDGSVWTATVDGLHRIAGGSERTYGMKDGLPGKIITALHEDSEGALWVATTKGIARSVGGQFEPLEMANQVRLEQVRSMTSDSSGSLWLCDQVYGLFRLKDGTITQPDNMFEGRKAYSVFTDRIDRVWIGLWDGGVGRYDNRQSETLLFAEGALAESYVSVMYEDKRGAIWIGTGQGLIRFDQGRFTTFTQQGLPKSSVVSIVEDDQGNLWFGFEAGLVRISPDEFSEVDKRPSYQLQYKLYRPEEGLRGALDRPGMPSSARGVDGSLWFITSAGLALIRPDRLRESPAPGPLRIESILADGTSFEPQLELRFSPGTSRIQIDYSLLNLTAAQPRFRYRLEGFDSDWTDVDKRRTASFMNLSPGAYRFRVVASDESRRETEATLDFFIRPAFYQTTPFYLTIVVIVASGIWTAWRVRLRYVQREFALVLAERVRMAREIHDTLLQSLVGAALEFDDILGQLGPSSSESLKKQVSQACEQVEEYIREARQSIWNLRSSYLGTNDLAKALRRFGERATIQHGTRFEFAVVGEQRPLPVKLEEQLLRIGQEALRNAAHHASAELIRLELRYEPNTLRLEVLDDGRGFDLGHLDQPTKTHCGIASMRERAQEVGARFTIVSSPGAGTTVEIVAPYSSAHAASHAAP